MEFVFKIVASVFLLLAAVSCAPGLLKDKVCVEVRDGALLLNQVAKSASEQAWNRSKDVSKIFTGLAFMEATDKCDPENMASDSLPCVNKIFKVLTGYQSALQRVSEFQSCSNFALQVKPPLDSLHTSMSRYIKMKGGEPQKDAIKEEIHKVQNWQKFALCKYILDRVFSFSILTARVFAVGDPAHHSQGLAVKCV